MFDSNYVKKTSFTKPEGVRLDTAVREPTVAKEDRGSSHRLPTKGWRSEASERALRPDAGGCALELRWPEPFGYDMLRLGSDEGQELRSFPMASKGQRPKKEQDDDDA
jgi:hypothetical protein